MSPVPRKHSRAYYFQVALQVNWEAVEIEGTAKKETVRVPLLVKEKKKKKEEEEGGTFLVFLEARLAFSEFPTGHLARHRDEKNPRGRET